MPSQSPSQSRFSVRLFAALIIASIGAVSAVEVSALPAKPNVILFLSDNGASAESPKVECVDPDAPLWSVASYTSYGVNWATVSNTPMRKWKSTIRRDAPDGSTLWRLAGGHKYQTK